MHDLNFFRNNLDTIRERLASRGYTLPVEQFKQLDNDRRRWITESENYKAERNRLTAEIGNLRKLGQDTSVLQQKVRAGDDGIRDSDEQAAHFDKQLRDLLADIPNLPQDGVPVGKDEHSNVEIRRWGTPRDFDFQPKAHWDLGPELGMLDMERAAKVAGARFAVYWGVGARLERALINFMLDLHTREHSYQEVLPPFLINSASLYGTGQLPKF